MILKETERKSLEAFDRQKTVRLKTKPNTRMLQTTREPRNGLKRKATIMKRSDTDQAFLEHALISAMGPDLNVNMKKVE